MSGEEKKAIILICHSFLICPSNSWTIFFENEPLDEPKKMPPSKKLYIFNYVVGQKRKMVIKIDVRPVCKSRKPRCFDCFRHENINSHILHKIIKNDVFQYLITGGVWSFITCDMTGRF